MRRAGRKRAFERRDGLLRDRYRGVDGRTIVSSMPGSMVGEPVAKAEPPFRRAEIGGDDARRADRAMYALADEHSPEMLEQLLIALAKQHMSAPMLPCSDNNCMYMECTARPPLARAARSSGGRRSSYSMTVHG